VVGDPDPRGTRRYLASPASDVMTGQPLVVDGGVHLHEPDGSDSGDPMAATPRGRWWETANGGHQ